LFANPWSHVKRCLNCLQVTAFQPHSDSFSDWEFQSAINFLNHETAASAYGISAASFLLSISCIIVHLIVILNACLSLFYFPVAWKSVKVRIIGKPHKSSYNDLKSLRPINLTSNFIGNFYKSLFLVGIPGLPNLTTGWAIDSMGSIRQVYRVRHALCCQ
jgi:hypothetical protein